MPIILKRAGKIIALVFTNILTQSSPGSVQISCSRPSSDYFAGQVTVWGAGPWGRQVLMDCDKYKAEDLSRCPPVSAVLTAGGFAVTWAWILPGKGREGRPSATTVPSYLPDTGRG